MARDLDSDLADALGDDVVRPVLLFDAEFTTGWLYLWTGDAELDWNGNTYTGIGSLINLSSIEETGEVRAAGVTVSLAGLDTAITSIALQSLAQNKTGRIYFGLLDSAGAFVGGDPVLAFQGRLDIGEVSEQAESSTVTIKYESRLVDLEKPREWRWTDQDQRTTWPDDAGLQFSGRADQVIPWGPS